jgi:hypothetical protein
MTVIVGAVTSTGVYMVADTLTEYGGRKLRDLGKVVQNDHMLVGGAGDGGAISRVFLEFSSEVDTPEAFLVLVEETLKEVDYTADFLIATRDGLFLLDHTLALITLDHVFAAIGSGAEVATGFLHARREPWSGHVLRMAVKAACTYCTNVGLPGKVFTL